MRFWWRRRKAVAPRPRECHGLEFGSAQAAHVWSRRYADRVIANDGRIVSVGPIWRCEVGHFHVDVEVDYPREWYR
jgi:hypothetical protein